MESNAPNRGFTDTRDSQQEGVNMPQRPRKHDLPVVPEFPEGMPPRTGYGDEEVGMLRDAALQKKAEGRQDVDISPIPENTYRTPKEKIAAAIEKYTPSTSGEGSHGVHRLN